MTDAVLADGSCANLEMGTFFMTGKAGIENQS